MRIDDSRRITWAIGDTYAGAEALARYARQYRVESRKADARLVRFVNLMVLAFAAEVEALQVRARRRGRPGCRRGRTDC